MQWSLGLQQSKLARRLLGVFLVCVVVPVVGLATVSYLQVRDQLIEQSLSRLDRDSRAVVMSVLERLVLADGVMRTLTMADADGRLADRREDAIHPVSAAVWTDGSGTALRAFGEWTRIPAPAESESERLQQGSVLRFHPEAGTVILARETAEGQLWVSVDTTFLWASATEFAGLRGEGISCVVTSDARPVRCDPRMAAADLGPHLRTRDPFTLHIGGEPYRAVTREIYFDWYFGAEPWSVVLAEPYTEAVASLNGFRRTFLPVALLSILVVMFFSSLQLRRIFARLLHLKSATDRMARGDFAQSFAMGGDDEIAELAGSFDVMATQLGQQFSLIRATGAVDRAALETETVAELCTRVVDALGETFGDSPRLVFLGLVNPHEGLDGSLAYGLPGLPKVSRDLSLTPECVSKIGRLVWSGLHPVGDVAEMLSQPSLTADTDSEHLALFPVRLDGQTHGFVAVGGRASMDDNRAQGRQLADQIAVALSNVKRLDQLERLNWGALTALARTVDAVSQWTAGHSERVASLSEQLGRRLGLPERELERLKRGGLLHDIGKIGVPSAILENSGKLTDEEFSKMQEHTVIGAKILEPIESFADILPLVLYHHERIDGAGYPMRVSGSAIPYGARIMAVADTYDALTSDRPYRKGMDLDRAISIMVEVAGTQLDTAMVAEFVAMVTEAQQVEEATLPTPPDNNDERRIKRRRKAEFI